MKSPLLLLLSLVIPNCRVPEKGSPPMAVVGKAVVFPNRPLPVDGVVELY